MSEFPITTETEEPGQFYVGPAIPVHIESSAADPVRPIAPEYTSCQQYIVAQQGSVPTQILQRRLRRYKASLMVRGGAATSDTWINTNPQALQSTPPVGAHFHLNAQANNSFPDYYGQQPLYAISTQPDVEISVIDMSFGET